MTSLSKIRSVKVWSWVAAFLLLAVVSVGDANAQTLKDKIQKGMPVVVATEDDYRPFEFIQDGKPAGLDNELFQLMKAEAKFDLRQEILPWTGLLAGVSSGKYDAAVTGALINQERLKAFDFAMPIAANMHYYLSGRTTTASTASRISRGRHVACSPEAYCSRGCPSSKR